MEKTIKLPDFKNEPGLDFNDPEIEECLNEALQDVRDQMGGIYPVMISGVAYYTPERLIKSVNPSDIKEVVGYVSVADESAADAAISAMRDNENVKEWMSASHAKRAQCLRIASNFLRWERFRFIALMILEAGKNRWEADGEFCEAIDFLEYYAAYAPFLAELQQATLISPSGERNEGLYEPLGIGVSIQPRNFPLAISLGPLAAGLVMGNPMIYKPAEQTSVIGYYLAQCIYESGIPEDVFHFLPGYGKEVGNYLVRRPDVRFVAFTGSKDVRRLIQDEVHKFNREVLPTLPPNQRHEKVIAAAESGGKGTIIVDSDADPQDAAQGIFDSAFGYQGQKCSAGTRVIFVGVVNSAKTEIINLLRRKIRMMKIGTPEDPENFMGPMISEEAKEKVEHYKNAARETGEPFSGKDEPLAIASGGYFVSPMLVRGLAMDSPIMQEEIFGPVLAIVQAASFEEALKMANDSEFGLTGGVYTNNDEHWQMAVERFEVGNLYRNRKVSGSIVAQNPFGGFKMSGESRAAKAGGWDYLLNFCRRKNLCSRL